MSDNATKPREWTVKCLVETFCPQGALLLGPEIKTDSVVILKDDYDALQKQLDEKTAELEALKKQLGKERARNTVYGKR